MLELLRMDVVYFLVLVSLSLMLFGPLACVWVVWSIRRDIHRIANAVEYSCGSAEIPHNPPASVSAIRQPSIRDSIVPSAFGR